MTLRFKGTVDALPAEGVAVNDAYYFTDEEHSGASAGYRYCSVISGSSITWASYDPIQVIKDVIYTKVWACKGAPSASSNAAQFPTLGLGCFAVDVSTGDYYGWDGQWKKWTGTAVIAL